MAQLARQRFTFADYLDIESAGPVRHEFLDGVIYAMAGGSPEHSGIAVNVAAALILQLRGRRCRVFNSDLRMRVRSTGLATYPDGSVICDRVELDPEDTKGHTAVNPTVLIEVLSPSNRGLRPGREAVALQAHRHPARSRSHRARRATCRSVASGRIALDAAHVP